MCRWARLEAGEYGTAALRRFMLFRMQEWAGWQGGALRGAAAGCLKRRLGGPGVMGRDEIEEAMTMKVVEVVEVVEVVDVKW